MRYKKNDIQEVFNNNLYHLISDSNISNSKFILAISGGIDSVALSSLILKIKDKIPINLSLFHMNYNMHSKADEMEKLCAKIAYNNNLQIFIKKINSKSLFKNSNVEAKAREIRYRELSDICYKNKINYILTAHHQEDQI